MYFQIRYCVSRKSVQFYRRTRHIRMDKNFWTRSSGCLVMESLDLLHKGLVSPFNFAKDCKLKILRL